MVIGGFRIRVQYIVHFAESMILQTSNHYTLYIKLTLGCS